ncbi:host-nuclease inhibitor Gam family protein [Sphingomonas sp. BK580]|uniref:host-nuclease inhibitor Gam family protein n=1 Tax=Sphingomonas sp. BK580 TaxID=2586972 RepID=UPI001614B495|nr:host-nuclease inhibitor Gam family protein [Sphingomonas sp. BK580]MBB3691466.1 phage host-nuclease inhibitor protein Gam [Sphingomonas sp. BK580]
MTVKLRINGSLEQASPLFERFARLGYEIQSAEVARDKAIADTNAVADAIIAPMIAERDQLREQLEPWWRRTGFGLLPAKRKTMELLGCIVGSKAGRSAVVVPGTEDEAVAALKQHRWAKDYVRVTEAVDKTAVRAALKGPHGDKLRGLGFGVTSPGEEFVLERAAQDGTMGKAA